MLYAACRLTQMWGYRFEEIRHTRPVLEYLMDKKTTERVAKIKRQKNHSPENLDTLGYYHLKMAYYKGAQSAKGKAHVEHARKYLSAGLEHDGLSARTKSAIQGHLGLLDEVIQKAQ